MRYEASLIEEVTGCRLRGPFLAMPNGVRVARLDGRGRPRFYKDATLGRRDPFTEADRVAARWFFFARTGRRLEDSLWDWIVRRSEDIAMSERRECVFPRNGRKKATGRDPRIIARALVLGTEGRLCLLL